MKASLELEKQSEIKFDVATKMGIFRGLLTKNVYSENDLKNADKLYFIFNKDYGCTIVFLGTDNVKYTDVDSGG